MSNYNHSSEQAHQNYDGTFFKLLCTVPWFFLFFTYAPYKFGLDNTDIISYSAFFLLSIGTVALITKDMQELNNAYTGIKMKTKPLAYIVGVLLLGFLVISVYFYERKKAGIPGKSGQLNVVLPFFALATLLICSHVIPVVCD